MYIYTHTHKYVFMSICFDTAFGKSVCLCEVVEETVIWKKEIKRRGRRVCEGGERWCFGVLDGLN